MENIVENPNQEHSFFNEQEMISYLLETSKWAKLLAILGFVGIGILVLMGIFVMVGLPVLGKFSASSFPMGFMGFFYFIIAALYYVPVNDLYIFSKEIKSGILLKNIPAVTYAFKNLKSMFKYIGIFTIVILSIYALAFLITMPIVLVATR